MHPITIHVGELTLEAELNDTGVAGAVREALPLEGQGRFWGDEIYFSIPVSVENEDATTDLEVGDLAYWPGGNAFCIFYGPTPASANGSPVPASPVTVIGTVKGDAEKLKEVDRVDVRVESAS